MKESPQCRVGIFIKMDLEREERLRALCQLSLKALRKALETFKLTAYEEKL